MNIRRGLLRLFLVLTCAWYVWGAFHLYHAWNQYSVDRQYELQYCLKNSYVGASLCTAMYTSASNFTTEHALWLDTLSIALLPFIVYGTGEICGWIIQGFKRTVR